MGIDQLPPQPKTIPITFASNLQNIQTAGLRAAPACGGPPSRLCSIERSIMPAVRCGSCGDRGGSCCLPSGVPRLLLLRFVGHQGLGFSRPAGGALGPCCCPPVAASFCGGHWSLGRGSSAGGAFGLSCRLPVPRHRSSVWSAWFGVSGRGAAGAATAACAEFARDAAAASSRLPPRYAKGKLKNISWFISSSDSEMLYMTALQDSLGIYIIGQILMT